MYLPQTFELNQLPLFKDLLFTSPLLPLGQVAFEEDVAALDDQPDVFSELSLRGKADHCLSLLAPMLREMSEQPHVRWLTLIDPPHYLTQGWLRDAGLNRERILLLRSKGPQNTLKLACDALRLGRSHTVISWIDRLDRQDRQALVAAACDGETQSLNIRMG